MRKRSNEVQIQLLSGFACRVDGAEVFLAEASDVRNREGLMEVSKSRRPRTTFHVARHLDPQLV